MHSNYWNSWVNSYLIIIELLVIIILSVCLYLSSVLIDNSKLNKIVINDGLIYKNGEANPYTGRILDTLQNHLIIEYDVVNGLKNGEFFVSTVDGIFTVYGFIENNKNIGRWQYYFENGQLECTGDFEDDKPIGSWIWYYETGIKKCEGVYLKGKPEGKWIQYDEDGYPNSVVNYKFGDVISYVEVMRPKMI